MKHFNLLLPVTLLSVLAASGQAGKPDAGGDDLKAVQGTWTMVFAASGGQALPPEGIAHHQLVMRDDKYTLFKEEDKVNDHGTFKLDPTAKPRAIDITEDQGPNKGVTSRGIYLLDGDIFIVCYNLPHMGRPTTFTSRADSSIFLFIYKRERN
jgi:uncharacterized protein (TIGR03067 family)